jgi:two-component sensor histidine kinase
VLSQAQYRLGNYPEALQSGLKAVEVATAVKDSSILYMYHLHLGNIYQDLKQHNEALFHFSQGLWYLQKWKPSYYSVNTISLISKILTQQGKKKEALAFLIKRNNEIPAENIRMKMFLLMALADIYMLFRDFAQAERQLLELLRYNEKRQDPDMYKMAVYERTGQLYLEMKEYDKAAFYLEKGRLINTELKSLNGAIQQHLLLFKVDSARGHFEEAIRHYQQYKALNDSIFNEKNSKQIASLQVQHQTIEKEQNIALLTKQNEMQQANLKQKDFHQKIIIAGSLMLLLLLSLSYNRYCIKKKSNRLLETKQQEINQKNQSLQQVLVEKDCLIKDRENLLLHKDALLEEKEWLLKEIHHRVKNNLQIVMSLLNTQAAYLKDSKALSAIQESQQRVHAISLIHQKLYQAEKVALIQMESYIREVVDYLKEYFNNHDHIRFELAIAPLQLDVAIAVPLGLIINEAVTNCLKYAFPQGGEGIVSISLGPVDQENYLLIIEDDGIGLGPDFDITRTRTLGMNLIKGLSKQLKAGLQVESREGLKISVWFNNAIVVKPFAHQALPG